MVVMLWLPAASNVVVQVAVPLPELKVTVFALQPGMVAPSTAKLSVPLMVTAPVPVTGETVAVKVSEPLVVEVGEEVATEAVVLAWFTTSARVAEVLPP